MAFAENTSVPVSKTRAEIERLIIAKHKCESFQSGINFNNRTAVVQFKDQTVGTLMLPVVARAYETGTMPSDRLLPESSGGGQ